MCFFFGIYQVTKNLIFSQSYVKDILLGAVRNKNYNAF